MSDLGLQDVKEKISQSQLEAIEVIEEYLNSDGNKYQALVKMPTGARVIIVTGCSNVLISRVSETFIIKIHALLRVIRYNCCK